MAVRARPLQKRHPGFQKFERGFDREMAGLGRRRSVPLRDAQVARVRHAYRRGVMPAIGSSRARSCSGMVRIRVGPPRGWKYCST